jgi:hypothetical protein
MQIGEFINTGNWFELEMVQIEDQTYSSQEMSQNDRELQMKICIAIVFRTCSLENVPRHTVFAEKLCIAMSFRSIWALSSPRHTLYGCFSCIAEGFLGKSSNFFPRHTLSAEKTCFDERQIS